MSESGGCCCRQRQAVCSRLPSQSKDLELSATLVKTFLAYKILSETRCSVVELSSEVDGSDVVTEESVGSSARVCRLWDRRRVETIQHHIHLDVSGSISTVGSATPRHCAVRWRNPSATR